MDDCDTWLLLSDTSIPLVCPSDFSELLAAVAHAVATCSAGSRGSLPKDHVRLF